MIRTVSLCRALARLNIASKETCRVLQRFQPLTSCNSAKRYVQTSHRRFADDSKSNVGKRKRKAPAAKEKEQVINKDVREAAVKVSKSLPGDWTKTSEELLERLKMLQHPTPQAEPSETPTVEVTQSSLLSTMEVGRSFSPSEKRERGQRRQRAVWRVEDADDLFSKSEETKVAEGPKRTVARRSVDFTKLYGAPRLNIFNAKEVKKQIAQQGPATTEPDDLWRQMDAEQVRRAKGGIPNNAFEEMIQWTKEGKLWKFPIDNESDMDEERKYKFHDHVFLEHHLKEFPDKGPIRKFMELVVLGLSKNPFITVPEKVEHIQWFAEYFREKQDIIQHAIGEQGVMKPKTEQIESES